MKEFYVPSTKGELMDWLIDYDRRIGKRDWKKTNLKKLSKSQLYAMFYRIRRRSFPNRPY